MFITGITDYKGKSSRKTEKQTGKEFSTLAIQRVLTKNSKRPTAYCKRLASFQVHPMRILNTIFHEI